MRSEVEVREELGSTGKFLEERVDNHQAVYLEGYREALEWVLGVRDDRGSESLRTNRGSE